MKQYKIYKTNNNEYSIETITTTYFFSVKMGESFNNIDNLNEEQLNTIINILELNEYVDITE